MLRYVLFRILWVIPILFGVAIISFVIAEITMANSSIDPASMLLPIDAEPEDYAALRERLGLDLPVIERFLFYVNNLLHVDLGLSYSSRLPVLDMILLRIPNTMILALWATFISVCIAIPLGIYASVRRNTAADFGAMTFALIGLSLPGFWLGIMLMLIFSVFLDLLPAFGAGGFEHLILPGITLSTMMCASSTRLMRSSMLEVVQSDYIRTARAKGVSSRMVIYKHGLRNSLIPVLTNVGLQSARLMGGALVIEVVFGYPGLGQLTYTSILYFDIPMLQGCLITVAFIFVFVNLIVDLTYAYIDPRIHYE